MRFEVLLPHLVDVHKILYRTRDDVGAGALILTSPYSGDLVINFCRLGKFLKHNRMGLSPKTSLVVGSASRTVQLFKRIGLMGGVYVRRKLF